MLYETHEVYQTEVGDLLQQKARMGWRPVSVAQIHPGDRDGGRQALFLVVIEREEYGER